MATQNKGFSQGCSDIETVRQRAMQAVEYYQRQMAPVYSGSKADNPHPGEYVPGKNYGGYNYMSTEDDLHSGVEPASSSNFYRAKMKAGIIDMRSSMSERIGTGRSRSRTFHGLHSQPGRARTHTYSVENKNRPKPVPPPKPAHMSKSFVKSSPQGTSKALYRSNSNAEMDSLELIEDDLPPTGSMHREYGSTSSLDLLGTSGDNDFFAMLKDFQNQNLDQRSPAPLKLHELLRGRADLNKERDKVSNGSVNFDKENDENLDSPKVKNKSKQKDRKTRAKSITGETSAGILKKLRGSKPDADITSKLEDRFDDGKGEERCRRKAFAHFDCQSVGVNLNEVIRTKHNSGIVRNTTTGASAASFSRNSYAGDKDDPDIIAGTDDGDGKSNNLVLSCPFFRNEIGGEEERIISLTKQTAHKRVHSAGDTKHSSQTHSAISWYRHPQCCGVAVLDSSQSPSGKVLPPQVSHRGHIIEYVDHGAFYYRHFFNGFDHQNYFGTDENLGPIAISIRREKLDCEERTNYLGKPDYGNYQYRIICRTSELTASRGAVLEEAVPTSSRLSSSRGVPNKEVLEFVLPEVQLSCLRLASPGPKTAEQLIKLDEQGISSTYKVGIMYCQDGQSSEEEMYNNESGSCSFDEFLELIGNRVKLKGFDKYRGGLDCKTNSTGTHSYYTTFNSCEIMFHVSTMLPYTPSNKQQLLRKRHIGNDIVTIVFQEAGTLPFTPKTVRSQFQHVFIIVKVSNPNTENVRYSISVTRSKDVPPFGPPIPENSSFTKSAEFVDFLLAKVINAENAAHKSDKFRTMATRTRQEYLKDLATNYVTTSSLDSGSKLSKFALGSGRKKERSKQKVVPDLFAKGAIVWNIQIEDFGSASQVDCLLGIGADTLVIIDDVSKDVIFMIPSGLVIGWTVQTTSLRLFFNQGECILMKPSSGEHEELQEIIQRLTAVTQGCETIERNLKRNGLGQLGFHIQSEGIVTDVEDCGFAWQAGLRKGSRLVEICKVTTATLSHEQIVDLLRTAATVRVVLVDPFKDGTPRGGEEKKSSSPRSIQPSTDHQNNYDGVQRFTSHMYNDSTLSSGRSSDDGRASYQSHPNSTDNYMSRADGHLSSGDELHSRNSSHDSSDYSASGSSSRHWNPRSMIQNQNQVKRNDLNGGMETSQSVYVSGSESVYTSSSQSTNYASPQRRHYLSSQQTDFSYTGTPLTGNIALELLKQSQNTKYLLRQGADNPPHGFTSDPPSSSNTNLSQISEGSSYSSGSSHAQVMSKESKDRGIITSKGDPVVPQRKDSLQHMNKPFKVLQHKRSQLDGSPHSSTNSSPRSSNRNLSGMSSEESLATRLRPGATSHSRPLKPLTSNFQEELMRLIDPDVSEKDLANFASRKSSHPHRSHRLQRTMSDESLHNTKGTISGGDHNHIGSSDALFSSAIPVHITRMEDSDKEQRLSPRAIMDTKMGVRPRSHTTMDSHGHNVPLPETTAGLDWSNLVDVATKAIESEDGHGKSSVAVSSETQDDIPPPRPPSPQDTVALTASATSWRSAGLSPQQAIQELEMKLAQVQEQMEKERKEKLALESENQQLRSDNVRLQEESQTAAAQLRRFTEWFFNTIDRQ
ncbi:signal-induced proliferation-associated 1-like protein 2 isoform X2 [Gigantopelta aegis]|uniref:signal-induced proliferation-associated 1-like protein 2 isoform X2 n=1 Tax=Gigantopelta aegis TaxID=1735272 RepID=UPI001B887CF7|nr:signal-induced proliferation-associated 1-like protein 2 isoform X2 [Gigantopelta aegis]